MKIKAVAICWMDAETATGWRPQDNSPPPHVWSVGFLLQKPTKAKPWYVICGDIGEDATDLDSDKNRYLKIPKGMVIHEVELGHTDGETFWSDS